MLSTTSNSTSLSPRSRSVQRAWPSGGAEQVSATSLASPAPSSFRGLRLTCLRRSTAASSPSSTQRLRTRSTVEAPTPRTDAISASVRPPSSRSSSASSRMCACFRRCAAAFPFIIPDNSARSSALSRTPVSLPTFRFHGLPPSARSARPSRHAPAPTQLRPAMADRSSQRTSGSLVVCIRRHTISGNNASLAHRNGRQEKLAKSTATRH